MLPSVSASESCTTNLSNALACCNLDIGPDEYYHVSTHDTDAQTHLTVPPGVVVVPHHVLGPVNSNIAFKLLSACSLTLPTEALIELSDASLRDIPEDWLEIITPISVKYPASQPSLRWMPKASFEIGLAILSLQVAMAHLPPGDISASSRAALLSHVSELRDASASETFISGLFVKSDNVR